MNQEQTKSVMQEYFYTVARLLCYQPDPQVEQARRRILELVCQMQKCPQVYAQCLEYVYRTDELQTVQDCLLIDQDPQAVRDGLAQIKMDLLAEMEVNVLRIYDSELVLDLVRKQAIAGDIHACKLYACLQWLGIGAPENRAAAIAVWEQLASSGQVGAMRALIYAYGQEGMADKAARWETTLDLVGKADAAFAPIVPLGMCSQYTAEQVSHANMVLFLRQIHSARPAFVHIPMLYYAINSRDDDTTKMAKLASERNFNLLLQEEGRSRSKRIGF